MNKFINIFLFFGSGGEYSMAKIPMAKKPFAELYYNHRQIYTLQSHPFIQYQEGD